ncbi:MAG TPA: hypothetical protein VFT74_18170 [Isosphaeraceae bacterium]|nr:hypothetical protein [Isosphaeraceae bacterium]
MFLAYFGPETMMPMTSVLAVVAGVFMMLGRQTFAFFRVGVRKAARVIGLVKTPPTATTPRPSTRSGSRLDPAEQPIHGSHATEHVGTRPSSGMEEAL